MTLLSSLEPSGPDHPAAVRVGQACLSRSELRGAAGAVADDVAGADRVPVLATPSLQTVVAVVGCLLAGVAVVPVPPDAGPAERAHILADSGAQLWFGERPEDVSTPAHRVELRAHSSRTYPEPDSATAAFVLYTSGTTGAPKGVLMSRGAVAAGLDGLAQAWGWTPDDVLVHGLPLFHVHGLILGVLGGLRVGSPVVHTVRATPAAYAAAGGSLYFGVPTVWGRVCADTSSARALSGARLLVSGSASLPVSVFDALHRLTGSAPVERYGMSETLITLSTRAAGERRAGWVGVPLPGVHTRLRDEHGVAVAADGESVDELQVRTPTLFDGYLHRPEATAAAWTSDGWFRTGDLAVLDEQGFHRIVGRESTDLIKSGGYRIGAGEVETALLRHPAVLEAAVVGEPDDDLGQRVVAYVVGPELGLVDLSAYVAESLSVHKRPREVRVVDELPRNAMGKVQKKLLGVRALG